MSHRHGWKEREGTIQEDLVLRVIRETDNVNIIIIIIIRRPTKHAIVHDQQQLMADGESSLKSKNGISKSEKTLEARGNRLNTL